MVRLDSVNYTSSSEYSPRTRSITHLQIHHATTTSLSGLRALMAPGGRTVSANGAMGNDGHLMGVVPENMRAFTSATSFDNNSYTIEVCNTTLSPDWGISDACHWRLAQVAVDLHRQYGMPLDRAHIIGHREVPGTYATACPGPSMDLDRIVRYAHALLSGTAGGGGIPIEEEDMTPDQSMKLDAVYAALFGPANLKIPKMTWTKPFGEAPGEAYYGVLDIDIRTQQLVAQVLAAVQRLEAKEDASEPDTPE